MQGQAMNLVTVVGVATTANHSKRPMDVVEEGCFCYFDPLACVRNGVLSVFAATLLVLCIAQVIKLHHSNQRLYHQLFVFYCASFECILIIIHWIYIHFAQLELAVQYLKMLQLLAVCHFYLSRSARLLRREYLNQFVVIPVLGAFSVYFSTIFVYAVVVAKDTKTECFDPYWVMLSTVECLLVQFFLSAGVFITYKLNAVQTQDIERRAQKRNIWSIIIAFEISAFATLIYDAVMFANKEHDSCSEIYNHNQTTYSVIYLILMILKIVVPILTLLVVFHPVYRTEDTDETFVASGQDYGAISSTFSPYQHLGTKYRRLYVPGTEGHGSIQVPPSAYANPARRTQSFPRMPIIAEESEHTSSSSLPTTA
ncbi:uncharacterized protein [Amphiura filiformis]|uniref:uncharacterized protein n=1 Tax=Amphiura filiformis TaxID=82378 RepID=UPI003B214EE1